MLTKPQRTGLLASSGREGVRGGGVYTSLIISKGKVA